VVLEAGHCPHDEVPEQVNRAMVDWLQQLPVP
jgi:pimeloyl-ACP methyl ester carboxylesterase